eukprot:CAMPEP_0173415942 /NCGR_PEP_ID=MMETSP1356-20130122/85135_1 /TAXON_ID=77927 ORGANISM="Hemiselmis virescens, Strain PCC157" /NCGR_SAMPLE_ID=MMETSP1356 /ASSEMBLY_ACC=CAM_ASM_000847 /LENGTH=61 /DNA_ID=CAMNT_0014378231 /DNA_START=694 /DNA_END=880 /DNA_ORIENTATION=+
MAAGAAGAALGARGSDFSARSNIEAPRTICFDAAHTAAWCDSLPPALQSEAKSAAPRLPPS